MNLMSTECSVKLVGIHPHVMAYVHVYFRKPWAVEPG
jgi:hypothetical protein